MAVAAKICGLTTADAVAAAIAGGAGYLGFVFYPPSPRNLAPERAAALCAAVPPGIARVGLFVDADDAAIARVLETVPLEMLQLHGRETAARVAALKARFGRPVMKALAIAEAADVAAAQAYLAVADRLLFDARPPSRPDALPGGNGVAFDWRLIAGRRWPLPWMLSGGLAAENLAAAVRLTGAPAVDVSSGVEVRPGLKDPAKIAAFLALARSL